MNTIIKALGGALILPLIVLSVFADLFDRYRHRCLDWLLGPTRRRAPGIRQASELLQKAKTRLRVAYWTRKKAKAKAT